MNKNNTVRRLMLLCIVVSILIIPSFASAFSDVREGDWYYGNVMELRDRGIVNGYTDNTFKPQNNVSHGETLKMLTVLKGSNIPREGERLSIKDINPVKHNNHWAERYVQAAMDDNILKLQHYGLGYDKKATRVETAEYIINYINAAVNDDIASSEIVIGKEASSHFADAYGDGMNFLYESNIIKGTPAEGKNEFQGYRNVTRAEFTAMMDRAEKFVLYYKNNGEMPPVETVEPVEPVEPEKPQVNYDLVKEPKKPSYNINDYTYNTFKVEDMIKAIYHAKYNGINKVEFTYPQSQYSNLIVGGKMNTEYVELLRAANNYVRSVYSDLYFHENRVGIGASSDGRTKVTTFINIESPTFSDKEISERRSYFEEETIKEARKMVESGMINDRMSQYEIAKVLHDWVVERVSYDYSGSESSFDGYSALYSGKAVCNGYANLYNRMLRLFGIKAEGISGYVKENDEYHIWTEAMLDGTRYYIDPTWNDELKSLKYFTTDIGLFRSEREWDENYFNKYRGLID